MKITEAQNEVILAAADSDLIDKEFREGKFHIRVLSGFYGNTRVSDETFIASLGLCTIANLVGKHVVRLATDADFIDSENVIYIDGIPYAQLAKIVE